MRRIMKGLSLVVTFVAALSTGCSDNPTEVDPANLTIAFSGSQSCAACHAEINSIWAESGHPYSLIKVVSGVPTDQYSSLAAFTADPVNPPVPFAWQNISYVAGGYGWKMLWINEYGFVITSSFAGDPVQYNFADQSWSLYGDSYEFLNKPADCGRCHATDWQPDEDYLTDRDRSDNQDGLQGFPGKFYSPGVHCEECHGPGNRHVRSPEDYDLIVDRSSADCGRCHFRDAQNRVLAYDDFIQPNSQYDEWLHSGHAILDVVACVDCHDPHASVKYDPVAMGAGTSSRCEECHATAAAVNKHDVFAPTACVDCHMPFAVKSATDENDYVADMRTHLMDIEVGPLTRVQGMGLVGGNQVVQQDPANGLTRITLDFACYGCHQDLAGEGGSEVALSLEELSALAVDIHQPVP